MCPRKIDQRFWVYFCNTEWNQYKAKLYPILLPSVWYFYSVDGDTKHLIAANFSGWTHRGQPLCSIILSVERRPCSLLLYLSELITRRKVAFVCSCTGLRCIAMLNCACVLEEEPNGTITEAVGKLYNYVMGQTVMVHGVSERVVQVSTYRLYQHRMHVKWCWWIIQIVTNMWRGWKIIKKMYII
jgi:hypothetical protein